MLSEGEFLTFVSSFADIELLLSEFPKIQDQIEEEVALTEFQDQKIWMFLF